MIVPGVIRYPAMRPLQRATLASLNRFLRERERAPRGNLLRTVREFVAGIPPAQLVPLLLHVYRAYADTAV